MDLYEFYSGKCFDAYNELGAHVVKENVGKSRRKMVTGVDFVTYAPNAEAVTVTGEFNSWGETTMERCYDGSFFKCTNIRSTRGMAIALITVIRMALAWN